MERGVRIPAREWRRRPEREPVACRGFAGSFVGWALAGALGVAVRLKFLSGCGARPARQVASRASRP